MGPTPRVVPRLRAVLTALAAALIALGTQTTPAAAHGPLDPVASSYLARVGSVPAGLHARVVDGDQRLWLRVPPGKTVVVLDYRGAPYLRFSRSGVEVNRASEMYYLNQTPVPAVPPPNLTATTPPRWQHVSGAHSYVWHDGRLHALASIALTPGSSYVGPWRIPVLLDGRASAISGSVWHAPAPSIVWFWAAAVLLLCVLAAWRVRSPSLDARTARALALAGLAAIVLAAVGMGLHGRPKVSIVQLVELTLLLAFAGWGLWRVLSRRAGPNTYFPVAVIAIWEGVRLSPTLFEGFVLVAVPPFVARAASVLGVGAGLALVLLVFRLADTRSRAKSGPLDAAEGRRAPELA